MDFDLSGQQVLLKRTARDFVEDEIISIDNEWDKWKEPMPKEFLQQLLRKLISL